MGAAGMRANLEVLFSRCPGLLTLNLGDVPYYDVPEIIIIVASPPCNGFRVSAWALTSGHGSSSPLESSLSSSLGALSNVRQLKLKGYPHPILPRSLCQLSQLQGLWVRSLRELRYLPDKLGNLQQLATLDLECSSIKTLPATLPQLPRLQHLKLHCEALMEYPPGMELLTAAGKLGHPGQHLPGGASSLAGQHGPAD